MVEALAVEPSRPARVVWRAQLGLFHAGIWLGRAGPGRLVVYLPGTYDTPGTMAALDERSGILHPAYSVPAPALAPDPTPHRAHRPHARPALPRRRRRHPGADARPWPTGCSNPRRGAARP